MRIAIDAMGGDRGPGVIVDGAVRAARKYSVPIALVGRGGEIEAVLAHLDTGGLDLTIVDAPDVVGMGELSPADAVRRQPDSSLARAMGLLRHGQADGFFTAGNTGAGLAAAMFRLGRTHGVRRAALATPFPTGHHPCVLLDVGANAEVRPLFLLQFAIMGAAYAERVLDIANPRVGLMTIGEERGKGGQLIQDALPLLEASDLNFVGNIEGRDMAVGNVDVAVTDGFTGNVLIKFAEGASSVVQQILREEAMGDPMSLLGALLLRPALKRAWARMDYRAYGGAVLLGVRGVVVIGHGRSDQQAVMAGIEVAMRGVEHDLVGAIERRIARSAATIPDDEGDAR